MSVNRELCIHGVGAVVTGLAWGWLLGTVAPAVRYLGRSEPTVHTTELRNSFCQQMATPPWSYDLMEGIRKEVPTALESSGSTPGRVISESNGPVALIRWI